MKKLQLFLFVTLLFLGCKKEEKSWEYWDQKASETYKEIIYLSNNYVCSDIPNLSIKTITKYCPTYELIHNNDTSKFNKLHKEYLYYLEKSQKGNPVYAMCAANFAIKISCNNNKPHLVTSLNIELEDINIEMPKLYDEIINHYTDTLCSNVNNWQGVILYHGEIKEALAIKSSDHSFYQKITLYNQLNNRKLALENKQFPQIPNKKIILKCENSRIKSEFE